ncbi:MAG: ABC transporter permease [Actinomycetota bacterium]|nr:ABC transporter permease [Actinomycetota bacterium]
MRRARRYDRPRFLVVITALVICYLFAPIAIVVLFSFNKENSLAVFGGFSTRWYVAFLHDGGIHASLAASLEIGVTTMVIAAVLGTTLALGLERSRLRAARVVEGTMMLNLVSPEIATAVAALLIFTQLGITLSLATVIAANATWAIAYVTIIVRSRLASLNSDVEEAALDLYASQWQTIRLVTLPLLWPAILASSLLVFVMSFDDFITTYFVSGLGVPPLPVRIYSMIRFGVTPEINAIGTLMTVATVSLALAALALFALRRTRSGSSVVTDLNG